MNRKQIKRIRGNLRKISSQIVRDEVLKLYKVQVEIPVKYQRKGRKPYIRMQKVNHYPCRCCGELLRDKEVEIDHIKEVGEFKVEGKLRNTKYGDCRVTNWQEWMDNLFCEISNFQILCIPCHQKKTLEFNDYLRYNGDLL